MTDNAKRVALVTGAGSGIGKAVALALHGAGFTVALAGRRRETLQQVIDTLPSDRTEMAAFPTDVASPPSVQALFRSISDAFGRLDVLFNNAGIGAPAVPFEELTYEQWSAVLDTNVTGSFLCAQEAVKLMKRQIPRGGRIINNGSLSAHSPRPWSAPYTAAKHAITGLTKSIALDGRSDDIACGQIDIGNASTEMTSRMASGVRQADGSLRAEPTIDVEHVAQAVLYMACLPLSVSVPSMTVMATRMPFTGRG